MIKRIAAAALLALSCSKAQPQAAPPPVAFVNVNVVPMDREAVLPAQTVVVRDGRIAAMGPAASVAVPAGARRIDGTGRYLMPGLADMHVHLVSAQHHEDLSLLFVANGVTTVRSMWGTTAVLRLRERIAAGAVLGPRVFTSGPITDGPPPVWRGSRVVATPAQARAGVRADRRAGYDGVKVYGNVSVAAYQAMADEARRQGLPLWGHVPDPVGLQGALAAGQRSIEHLQGYVLAMQSDRSTLQRTPPRDVDETRGVDQVDLARLPALVAATRQAGAWNVPTLVVYRNLLPDARAAGLESRPSMRYVPPEIRTMWDPIRQGWLGEFTEADFARYRRLDALMLRITGALHAGGARVLLGTDAPNPYVVPGFSVHEELANLVAAGLSPYEALRAATAGPAEFLGQAGEFGTVAVGRRADLLLLEADPLRGVANAARRVGVMVNGAWHPEAELQGRLGRMAREFAGQGRELGLHAAALGGDVARIRASLAAGAPVDARNAQGQTALMVAAYAGHAPAVDALLQGGADVDAADEAGLTALMAAAYAGKTAAVQSLLRGGADVARRNRRGQTALDLAAYRRHRQVQQLLRAAAAPGP